MSYLGGARKSLRREIAARGVHTSKRRAVTRGTKMRCKRLGGAPHGSEPVRIDASRIALKREQRATTPK